jgi:hypothetical protein
MSFLFPCAHLVAQNDARRTLEALDREVVNWNLCIEFAV